MGFFTPKGQIESLSISSNEIARMPKARPLGLHTCAQSPKIVVLYGAHMGILLGGFGAKTWPPKCKLESPLLTDLNFLRESINFLPSILLMHSFSTLFGLKFCWTAARLGPNCEAAPSCTWKRKIPLLSFPKMSDNM